MNSLTVVGVYREKVFSPGKIQEDAAILDATLAELSRSGYRTKALEGEALHLLVQRSACVLTMAQSERVLQLLEGWEKGGTRIVNSVASVRNCYRKALIHLLAKAQLPIPVGEILPLEEVEKRITFGSSKVYWLKRGDVHAMQTMDVVKVRSRAELMRGLDHFRHEKIAEVLVQEHVEGEVIKFYGVGGDQYFSAFLSRSGDEVTSRMKQLQSIACRAAEAVQLEIYGGDAIMNQGGEVLLIDLNDWPSFSRCCHAAAKGIAKYITKVFEGGFHEVSTCS